MRPILLAMALMLVVPLAPAQQPQTVKVREAIAQVKEVTIKYTDAFNRKDAAGIAALFAENGVMVLPYAFLHNAAITDFYADEFMRGAADMVMNIHETNVDGNAIWAYGEFSHRMQYGKWVAVYERQAGELKVRVMTATILLKSRS